MLLCFDLTDHGENEMLLHLNQTQVCLVKTLLCLNQMILRIVLTGERFLNSQLDRITLHSDQTLQNLQHCPLNLSLIMYLIASDLPRVETKLLVLMGHSGCP
jgi:hypothetical protein